MLVISKPAVMPSAPPPLLSTLPLVVAMLCSPQLHGISVLVHRYNTTGHTPLHMHQL